MDAFGLPTISLRRSRLLPAVAIGAVTALVFAAASLGRATTLPNPCTILASAHAQNLKGTSAVKVTAGTLSTYGTGKYKDVSCMEKVGPISVYLSYYASPGGSGGVRITSQTHPAGFGGTATLTVGTGITNHAPVDYLVFKKGAVYGDLGANGADPDQLTALGQKIYKLTP
jgi:hypothetical protein